jgi:probable O-glycosylation ligase (exosortase A-associated)
MAVVGTMLIHGRNRVRWLLLVAALSIGMYGIKGGAWAVLTGGVHRVFGPAGSFLFDNNFFGLACVMVIPVMMMLAREEPNKWMRRLLYGAVVLNILAAVFTYSRGAVVGLAIVLPLLFLRSQQRILLLVFIVPLAFIGKDLLPEKWVTRQESTLNYEQDESAMQRLATWNVHLNVALDRPLVGAGFNFHDSPDVQRYRSYASPETIRYLSHAHGTAAHSVYFQLLGQHGFVGLGLFLGMLGAMYFRLRRIIRLCIGRKDVQWIASYASGLRIALIGYVVCGIFLSVAYFELLYLMVTVPAILAREMAAAGVGRVSTMVHRGTPLYPAAPAPKV